MDYIENLGKKNTITTLEIAEMMGIEHWQVLRKLEGQEKGGKHSKGFIEILSDNNIVVADYFEKSSYIDAQGKERPCYKVTRLGCDFLANKFTGEKGILFTAKYVKRFDEMEKQIKKAELPMTYRDAVAQLLESLDREEELKQQLDVSKDWYSIKRVAALNGVHWKTFSWRTLKDVGLEMGYEVKKIFDANYGEVNTYHKDVWEKVYPEYEI
jgi:Rha family phage regulatory protein